MVRLHGLGILICSILLFGCGDSTSNQFLPFIPDVLMECTSGQAVACSSLGGLTIFVGVKAISADTCNYLLSGTNETQRKALFLANTSVLSGRSGGALSAIATNWKNALDAKAYSLDAGDYQVCAFVDADGDGNLSLGDAVGTGKLTAGVKGARMTNWREAQ